MIRHVRFGFAHLLQRHRQIAVPEQRAPRQIKMGINDKH